MNILVRADSSSTIGTGHIMRDLVLAEQFDDANIIFATQELPGNINHKIEEKNYTIEILNSNDIKELISIIEKHSIEMIIIDHYGIDHNYEKALKEITGITIFVLDDTYEKHYCDILLNHNVSADESRYSENVPENCDIRCGIKHTLLRDEFKNITLNEKNIKDKKTFDILIAMGGTDPQKYNFKILELMGNDENLHLHFMTTSSNKNLNILKKHILHYKNMKLHVDSKNVALLMNQVDFAIVTPSVVVNELLFMQLPFIAIKIIDNQKEIYQFLKKKSFLVLNENEFPILKEYIYMMCQEKYYNESKSKIIKLKESKRI